MTCSINDVPGYEPKQLSLFENEASGAVKYNTSSAISQDDRKIYNELEKSYI